jgi:hypothetical protein
VLKDKIKTFAQRQPQYSRLALGSLRPNKIKTKRARKFFINIFATDFSLSFRRFKTNPANRTKLKKQFVLDMPMFGYKEIALTVEHTDLPPLNIDLPSLPRQAWASAAIVGGLVGLMVFGLNLTTPTKLVPVAKTYAQPTKVEPKPVSLAPSTPTELLIDKIQLDANIQPVDLDSNGSLAVPSSPSVTGWYDKSPTPGAIGPAIIDGHVDYIDNIAVFWRLRELVPGDTINVTRGDGTTAKFVVNAVGQYSQDNFPDEQVYGKINYAGLRLITCSGTFDTVTRHYSDNLVVYASLTQ